MYLSVKHTVKESLNFQFQLRIPSFTVYLESALFRLNVYETSLDELDLFVVPVNYIPIAITSSFKSTKKSLPFPIKN